MFIAVLSDDPEKRKQFCKLVGKETGNGDISFYSSNFQGTIRTLIEPTLYPDKVQPLLHTISLADHVVLLTDSLNQYTGEIIVALNSLKKKNGILVSSLDLPLKGTVLENYEKVETPEAAKEKILSLENPKWGEGTFALVDSAFQVKSVGNVILGAVKSGKIKKRDKLTSLPGKKEIEIKSIQLNDKESDEVGAGGRFGICYKGDPIERGILSSPTNSFEVSTSLDGSFSKSPFYKEDIKGKIHAYTNLQLIEGSVSPEKLTLEKPLASRKGEPILILDPSNPKLMPCLCLVVKKSMGFSP